MSLARETRSPSQLKLPVTECPANTVTVGRALRVPANSVRVDPLATLKAEVGPPWHSRLHPAAACQCPAQAGRPREARTRIRVESQLRSRCTIRSEVSFRFCMHNCFKAVVQRLSKSEKRFVVGHTLVALRQEPGGWASESEVLCVRTVLFVGKCGFRFLRFKKGSRARRSRH